MVYLVISEQDPEKTAKVMQTGYNCGCLPGYAGRHLCKIMVSMSECLPEYKYRHLPVYNCRYLPVSVIGLVGRVFANGLGDLGSILGHVIPKTLKMVLDTPLLNTQQ